MVCQRDTISPQCKHTLVVGGRRGQRDLADQLSGRVAEPIATGERDIRSAVDVFVAEKQVEGLTPDLIQKYTLWLGRLVSFCEGDRGFTLRGINRELLIAYCADWETRYVCLWSPGAETIWGLHHSRYCSCLRRDRPRGDR
jgi:hypothetical protein